MRKCKKLMALLLAFAMTAGGTMGFGTIAKADTCGGLEEVDIYEPGEDEVIKDPVLHWAIRAALNSIKDAPVLTEDIVGARQVETISYELCAHPEDFDTWTKPFWIENLEGIQYAKSATMVDICYTSAVEGKRIADVSPLSELTQLQKLLLKQNGIDDISSLGTLVNLTQLDVSGNREISDVSAIANMKKLKQLNISNNKIQDISAVSELENLEFIELSGNQIQDLPDLSKLTNVYSLDISHNELTDISALADLKNLRELNLGGNTEITDFKPLAKLFSLEKEKTFLPENANKEDLFAAIEVNKLFDTFNISKMQAADLENVEKALAAYDELTDAQKEYIGTARAEAARSNKQKIENEEEPEYYPEYDEGGTKQPVLDRLEIKVVDKYGNPMSGVEFVKTGLGTKSYYTDKNGMLSIEHSASDAYWDLSIRPAGDAYVASPSELVYEVKDKKTYSVNGESVTGFEEWKFVLIPKEEYVDKSDLAAALQETKAVEEEYKYTAASYQAYAEALQAAQNTMDDADATEEAVEKAAANLRTAWNNLTKADILTELKLVVKDENGNVFTRPFKFQVRVPVTGAEAWNQLSDPETGLTYLQASPGWQDNKQWEILACYEEPYEIDPIMVTIGVSAEGTRYFKTVDGEAVGVDFEKEVILKSLPNGAPDKEHERKPDSTVLQKYIEAAMLYEEGDYTPETYEKLQKAVADAQSIVDRSGASQEEYNAAAAALKTAESALVKPANKLLLEKEISKYYSQDSYTVASWNQFTETRDEARAVYENPNASQEEVDNALANLQNAQSELVLRANKTSLGQKLTEAKGLNADDYVSGYDELQTAIEAAQAVYDDTDATQEQVDGQFVALEAAMNALVEKTVEVDYACYASQFRAKVMDAEGKPLTGVKFTAWIDDKEDEEFPIVSDLNGVIGYTTYGPMQYGHTVYIRLADDRYTTSDEHYFTVNNSGFLAVMATVDGRPFVEGTRLTYVLKTAGDIPQPPKPEDKVLSDETTFRAKVVDESGNPVNGVTFVSTPNDPSADTYELVSENGVIEQKLQNIDYDLTFTVAIEAEQDAGEGKTWTCSDEHTFKTDGSSIVAPKITHVDEKSLADAGEIVFTLKKEGGDTPGPAEVKKDALQEQINIARLFDGKGDDYTEETYNALQAAIVEAEKVYNDSEATQAQVDEWTEKLEAARKALKEKEKPVVCDRTNIRILIQDADGNPVTDRITFTRAFDNGRPGYCYSREGVLEYNLSTADEGIGTITFSAENGTVILGEKEYILEPEKHVFTLESGMDVVLSAIDGEPLNGTQEVKFILKEKTAEVVDKTNLQSKLDEMKAINSDNYTANSYRALQDTITSAQKVFDNENAVQAEVDQAVKDLDAAKAALKEVTGMRVLTIPVTDQNGNAAPVNTRFVRYDAKYRVENNMYVKDGQLVWTVGSYEGGDYEFYLPSDSAYIATPAVIKVHVGDEDGTPVIDTIGGQPAADGLAKFVLTPKSNDTCDILTFRAFVQDSEGRALSGVKFNVANGDPAEIISDENGMIEYAVTAWDTDTTMKVTLQDGQEWTNEEAVEFAVIVDPGDENRGIISTVNGKPVAEIGRIVFTLEKKSEPQKADKTLLQAAMERAGALDAAKYTEDSFAKVTAEIEKAVQIYADETVSQEAVDAQTNALNAAMAALVEKEEPVPDTDKTALKTAIDRANALDKSKYTEESYAEVEKALADAVALYEDSDALQADIDNAAKALDGAIDALKEKNAAGEEGNKPSDKPNNGQKPNDSNKGNGSAKDKTGTAVQTGDSAHTVSLFIIMVMSVLAIYVILRKRIKA